MDLSTLLGGRGDPRYDVRFHVDVSSDWQERAQGILTNVSRQGVRIEGTRELVDKVFPNFNPPKGSPRPQLQLTFESGGELGYPVGSISVWVQTVYVRRLALDRFQIGMQFTAIEQKSERLLEELIRGLAHKS